MNTKDVSARTGRFAKERLCSDLVLIGSAAPSQVHASLSSLPRWGFWRQPDGILYRKIGENYHLIVVTADRSVLASPAVVVALDERGPGSRAVIHVRPRVWLIWCWGVLLLATMAAGLMFTVRNGATWGLPWFGFAIVMGLMQWGFAWLAVPDYERSRDLVLGQLRSILDAPLDSRR